MATELFVRTERAEYTSGDTVYGAVYLKISGPTCADGVQIKFFGYETFMYESKKHTLDDGVIHDTKEYIASDQLLLYEFQDPISLGQYVFPFQKRLPMELPGSTYLKSSEWKVEIVYGVEASLIGAEEIKYRQNIIVTQPLLLTLSPGVEGCEEFVGTKNFRLHTWLPFIMADITVCFRMDRSQYHTGENLKLKLDIVSNGVIKPHLESIVFQLLRDLRITFKKLPAKDVEAPEHCIDHRLNVLPWDQWHLRLNEELIPDNTMSSGFVHPEGPSHIVQSSRLIDIEGTKLINGIQELLIPLKDAQGNDIPATTLGSHIWVMYSLKITIKFQRNDPVILHIPITSVRPRCSEWQSWKPGDWVYNCQVMSTENLPCSVSQDIIESVHFSELPSFQIV